MTLRDYAIKPCSTKYTVFLSTQIIRPYLFRKDLSIPWRDP